MLNISKSIWFDRWREASDKQIHVNQNLLNMTTEFKLLHLMKSKPILPVTYHEYGPTKYHMSQWKFWDNININMVGTLLIFLSDKVNSNISKLLIKQRLLTWPTRIQIYGYYL